MPTLPAVSRLFFKCNIVKEYIFITSCPKVTVKGRVPINVRIQGGTETGQSVKKNKQVFVQVLGSALWILWCSRQRLHGLPCCNVQSRWGLSLTKLYLES